MFTIQSKDGSKAYTITRHARMGGFSGKYFVWCLSEMSEKSDDGFFMRGKLIADFGNTAHKENYKNAKLLAQTLANK